MLCRDKLDGLIRFYSIIHVRRFCVPKKSAKFWVLGFEHTISSDVYRWIKNDIHSRVQNHYYSGRSG